LRSAALEIDHVPLEALCDQCGSRFRMERFSFQCERCGGKNLSLCRGEEVLLESVTLEECVDEPKYSCPNA
jgi:Zn finger protein HypA/HybF involved in hydrogenase expression